MAAFSVLPPGARPAPAGMSRASRAWTQHCLGRSAPSFSHGPEGRKEGMRPGLLVGFRLLALPFLVHSQPSSQTGPVKTRDPVLRGFWPNPEQRQVPAAAEQCIMACPSWCFPLLWPHGALCYCSNPPNVLLPRDLCIDPSLCWASFPSNLFPNHTPKL